MNRGMDNMSVPVSEQGWGENAELWPVEPACQHHLRSYRDWGRVS